MEYAENGKEGIEKISSGFDLVVRFADASDGWV